MKCKKCGAEMEQGYLYCNVCGAEYQIVPDFEPEIEDSIAEGLSDIHEKINANSFANEENEKQEKQKKQPKTKKPSFAVIFILILIFSAGICIGYLSYTGSVGYQTEQALKAVERNDYYRAAQIYENLRKRNTEDAYWYVKEAECKQRIGEEDFAYSLALQAIQLEVNVDIAYDFLLSYLEEKENYIELNQYLKECESEEIREKFWEYSGQIPALNYESGPYNHGLMLSFESGYQGTVYYTLNGEIPDKNSQRYADGSTIPMGNGTHILTVIYENAFGMISEPAVYEYHITSEIPIAPIVMLEDGMYMDAEMIEVEVEEGSRVFYTTDSSEPNMDSKEYTAPIPLPLGESSFKFVAFGPTGAASQITQRNYYLEITANVSLESAKSLLIQKLIASGHILDMNGAVQDRYGVFGYFYQYPIYENARNYYVFEEYYLENQIRNPLSNFYAVDVLSGEVYQMSRDSYGNHLHSIPSVVP